MNITWWSCKNISWVSCWRVVSLLGLVEFSPCHHLFSLPLPETWPLQREPSDIPRWARLCPLSLGRQRSHDPRTWTLKPGGSDLSLLLTSNSCITFGLGQVTWAFFSILSHNLTIKIFRYRKIERIVQLYTNIWYMINIIVIYDVLFFKIFFLEVDHF